MDGKKVLMNSDPEEIRIIYRTEKEAVVYKPARMATQLSDDIKGSSLESILKKQFGKEDIYFPHRLDRITRGLLLVCFDKETVAYYNEQMKQKKFEKHYQCLVEPSVPEPEQLTGIHSRFIKTKSGRSRIVQSGGKPSFLEIVSAAPSEDENGLYKVKIRLITGRTHQIRLMLSDLGIPLSGDRLYNPDSKFKQFFLESVMLKFTDTDGLERCFGDQNK